MKEKPGVSIATINRDITALKKSSTASLCTFICFAFSIGIPPQVVMKWTGHKDHKAMKPYIDIAEKVKAEQMAIFEKGLKD